MLQYNDVRLGTTQVDKVYVGTDLVFEKTIDTTAPVTTVYPDPTTGPYAAGTRVWLEVNEMCTTYYTLDGSTPTTASAIFREAFTFNETTTIKYFSVDVAGNTETVKTTTFEVTGTGAGVTTISPTSTTQNTIPFTVTLTNSAGATMYYRVGAGAQQTYTGPFEVSQVTNNVGVNISITYWSTGETEKTITYNTSGAIPGTAVVTTIPGNWYVRVNWEPTANTTSYSVYRSTVAGQLGDLISDPYQPGTGFDDNTPVNDTTYYYTVRSANYGTYRDSVQVSATPTGAPAEPTGYRYLKIEGYGSVEEPATTRLIEFEAWEGATNRMTGATILSNDAISLGVGGGTIADINDGDKSTSGYPLWWTSPTPNANVVIDLGAQRALTKLNYYSYSTSAAQRANRFKILASNTNNGTDWVSLWDMSGNTTPQPLLPLGYEKTL